MAPGRSQGGGCWTCRLRHKRCDSVRPVCGNCLNLEITCYSGKIKPPWMDGAVKQKQMSETIKMRIKQNTTLRRERRLLNYDNQSMVIFTEMDHVSHADDGSTMLSCTAENADIATVVNVAPAHPNASVLSIVPIRPSPSQSPSDRSLDSQSFSRTVSSLPDCITPLIGLTPNSSSSVGSAVPISSQLGSLMIYLDYVFPFLFPFYQPSLIETGRQWLLGLLCQNDVSFHIAAGLSAYFFTLVPQGENREMHDDCKTLVLDQLIKQIDLAITSIHNSVSTIARNEVQSPLLDRMRLMEGIAQLLMVEITVRRTLDWKIHLTPALALFDEVFQTHGTDLLGPNLHTLLSALPSPFAVSMPNHKPLPNTADQTATVFFVSLLLYIDILASTAHDTSPTLHNYHSSLLTSNVEDKYCIRLETIIGCQNWALVAIGNISALCAWKRDTKQSGSFSVVNLVNLARPISQELEEGLAALETNTPPRSQPEDMSDHALRGYYSRHDDAIDDALIASITRIWAYAAKIYLSVSLSGWQPNSTDVRASVNSILSLLQAIQSPAQLRSLSWPTCIAGCFASPAQEDDFRRIIGSLGKLATFGTMSDALRIMESVWAARNTVNADSRDIAFCLNILGSCALLL